MFSRLHEIQRAHKISTPDTILKPIWAKEGFKSSFSSSFSKLNKAYNPCFSPYLFLHAPFNFWAYLKQNWETEGKECLQGKSPWSGPFYGPEVPCNNLDISIKLSPFTLKKGPIKMDFSIAHWSMLSFGRRKNASQQVFKKFKKKFKKSSNWTIEVQGPGRSSTV